MLTSYYFKSLINISYFVFVFINIFIYKYII